MQLEYRLFTEIKSRLSKEGMRCRVVSDSMRPLLKPQDEVMIYPVTRELKRFDLVVFRNNKKSALYLHFLWRFPHPINGQELLITKGLNNRFEDEEITREDILGVVSEIKIPWYLKLKAYL